MSGSSRGLSRRHEVGATYPHLMIENKRNQTRHPHSTSDSTSIKKKLRSPSPTLDPRAKFASSAKSPRPKLRSTDWFGVSPKYAASHSPKWPFVDAAPHKEHRRLACGQLRRRHLVKPTSHLHKKRLRHPTTAASVGLDTNTKRISRGPIPAPGLFY